MKFDMSTCGGCRTCELACSFHHIGEFNPKISSIKILEKEGELGYEVLIVDHDQGPERKCDGCPDLEVPLCVDYCKEREELHKMIKTYVEEKL